MKEHVILVDPQDREIGTMEKIEAHEKALLHRAFSIFIFNTNGELLLQQRAAHKYHSPLLWTNTCCSHPRPEEDTLSAANRRLNEEMGLTSSLKHAFHFIYNTPFDNGLTEHELDHVFIGITDTAPQLNREEVEDYRYLALDALSDEMTQHPENFTSWFNICFPKVKEFYAAERKAKTDR